MVPAIVRWQFADCEADLVQCFHAEVDSAEEVETMELVADESEFLLFDPCFGGEDLGESLELSVPIGGCRISARSSETERVGFLVHVFDSAGTDK